MAEIWAAAIGAAGAAVSAGTAIYGATQNKGASGGGLPSYNYNFKPIDGVSYNPAQGAADLNSMFPGLSQYASQATAYQTNQREKIMPGSKQQFRQASSVLNSYLKGEVPQDVVDYTNRTVAQRTGGSFNPFTGGGRSQQDFARSIGRLSTDLTSAGLSAAPTWQQLANSFVTSTNEAAQLALQAAGVRYQYDALNTGVDKFNASGGMENAQNQYAGGINSYLYGQQAQQQQQAALTGGIGSAANALTGFAGQYGRTAAMAQTPSATYQGTGGQYGLPNAQASVYRPTAWRQNASAPWTGIGNPYNTGA